MDIFEKCFKPQPQEKIREMGLLRISPMATHTHELIDEAVEKIAKVLVRHNIS